MRRGYGVVGHRLAPTTEAEGQGQRCRRRKKPLRRRARRGEISVFSFFSFFLCCSRQIKCRSLGITVVGKRGIALFPLGKGSSVEARQNSEATEGTEKEIQKLRVLSQPSPRLPPPYELRRTGRLVGVLSAEASCEGGSFTRRRTSLRLSLACGELLKMPTPGRGRG